MWPHDLVENTKHNALEFCGSQADAVHMTVEKFKY